MSKLPYEAAQHAMQTGVAHEMEHRPGPTTPKSLRVGINTALCDHAALIRLLVDKGVISDDEYRAAITDEMNREVKRYEKSLGKLLGTKITLR